MRRAAHSQALDHPRSHRARVPPSFALYPVIPRKIHQPAYSPSSWSMRLRIRQVTRRLKVKPSLERSSIPTRRPDDSDGELNVYWPPTTPYESLRNSRQRIAEGLLTRSIKYVAVTSRSLSLCSRCVSKGVPERQPQKHGILDLIRRILQRRQATSGFGRDLHGTHEAR